MEFHVEYKSQVESITFIQTLAEGIKMESFEIGHVLGVMSSVA